jgi:hypothetical protein
MKNFTTQYLTTVILLTVFSFSVKGQTNVSGGIYTDTTWTLANSPYIVVDTIVIFPGVTLTIQPGVVVKFANNKRIEIRQAKLIALGTSVDSITFTSNSITPSAGIWSSLFFNGGNLTSRFSYCNFLYAINAILGDPLTYDTLQINNSRFQNNINGISGGTTGNWTIVPFIDSCSFNNNTNFGAHGFLGGIINHCTFSNNQTGFHAQAANLVSNCFFNSNQIGIECQNGNIDIENCVVDSNIIVGIKVYSGGDSITNCKMRNNGIGLYSFGHNQGDIITKNEIENNNTGIQLDGAGDSIFCNKICNNASYDLYYNVNFGSNISMPNNFWCTTDSLSTSAVIYDGYDNINKGLVSFMPLDTEQCFLVSGVQVAHSSDYLFSVSPNPASDYLTVVLPTNTSKAELKVFNLLGELAYSATTTKQNINVDITTLSTGVNIIQIKVDDKIGRQKFIKQ